VDWRERVTEFERLNPQDQSGLIVSPLGSDPAHNVAPLTKPAFKKSIRLFGAAAIALAAAGGTIYFLLPTRIALACTFDTTYTSKAAPYIDHFTSTWVFEISGSTYRVVSAEGKPASAYGGHTEFQPMTVTADAYVMETNKAGHLRAIINRIDGTFNVIFEPLNDSKSFGDGHCETTSTAAKL
jgi:hypothetical protein